IPYGTPPKQWRSNGTPSLQGGGCYHPKSEIPPDQYAVLVREFCQQQFVSKGMIADFAIHDPHPPGHNPHAHVLLTMRAMDEHGKWLPKSRKVYDLDENGERIS